MTFDPNLYGATLRACDECDVPLDLGRTPADQEIIKQVLPYLQSRGKE